MHDRFRGDAPCSMSQARGFARTDRHAHRWNAQTCRSSRRCDHRRWRPRFCKPHSPKSPLDAFPFLALSSGSLAGTSGSPTLQRRSTLHHESCIQHLASGREIYSSALKHGNNCSKIVATDSSTVCLSVCTTISASSGASYGASMPVNSWISPARAFL